MPVLSNHFQPPPRAIAELVCCNGLSVLVAQLASQLVMTSPAPWDAVPSEDQLFVLVTGANSGIGLGIAQQLVDKFLVQRSSSAHLVLVVTTRSLAKSRATLEAVRRHLGRSSSTNADATAAAAAASRIHLAGVELDLCRLPDVFAAAEQLVSGGVDVFTGSGNDKSKSGSLRGEMPVRARLPRLDVVIFNAGIGGWTGFSMAGMMVQFVTSGLLQTTTFPSYKLAPSGQLVDPLTGKRVAPPPRPSGPADRDKEGAASQPDDTLGEVFCANVFGHYVLAHALLPLLRRPPGAAAAAGLPPARIVWESSVEAYCWDNLAVDDLQGIHTSAAYESSKRLTDVLALTSYLPGVRRVSAAFVGDETGEADNTGDNTSINISKKGTPPRQYVTHPGIVCSSFFPLPALLFYLYYVVMYVTRWAGSPWHSVTAYKGATAAVWVALQPVEALDAAHAENVKWGSCVTRSGRSIVKKTEVEGWGWSGKVERAEDEVLSTDGSASSYLRNVVGRRAGAPALTAERRQDFEALGRSCWQEMERLRRVWEDRVAAHASPSDKEDETTNGKP